MDCLVEPSESILLHVDVDAFFASVEQLLIPSLRGRAVIVGSGCIASCSYEARRAGLRAGMELHAAMRRCRSAVILPGRYPIYRCFAEHVWDICRRYTCGLETYLDEAYGDATGVPQLRAGGPDAMGRLLRKQVRDEVGLSVSVGLAGNRMMAKIASTAVKPYGDAVRLGGVKWIPPEQAPAFLAPLPVEKLPGVGRKTARALDDVNIRTIGDLRGLSREHLRAMFGRRGEVLYERCRGRDAQLLRPAAAPKTISRETTFHRPTCDRNEIRGMLFYLLERAMRTARESGLLAGCVEVSIRYDDWRQAATSRSLPDATGDDEEVFAVVLELFGKLYYRRVSLRHVGVVLSKFRPAGGDGKLFDRRTRRRRRDLHQAVDSIRDRWGHAAVVTGESADLLGKLEQNDYGFILRTPSLTK